MSPREAIENNCLEALEQITMANGYDIPVEFRLITREILDFPETENRRPAVVLAFLESWTAPLDLGGPVQTTPRGMVTVHLDPIPGVLPATAANAYKNAIRHSLVQDRSCGQQNAELLITGELTPHLWVLTNPFLFDVTFEVEFVHSDEEGS
jgi:hypothetical protein